MSAGVSSGNKRKMIDLNELPPYLNELPCDMDHHQPSIPRGDNADYGTENVRSTQPSIGQNPMGHEHVALQSSARGAHVLVSLQSESHTLNDTGTMANVVGPTSTELGAGAVDGVVQGEEGEDEAGSTWVPCYFKHRFFPFLQSTQRSEGFNAVLKRYVKPNNSILKFFKQYEKIQTHILAKEGYNDYRPEHLEIELWSRFPMERQAYETYTGDLYRRFREEFELIGRYNAFQVGANVFELRSNQEFVAKYGS
ncbi:Protein FAR1-RELATED SEQUENCE 5 [Hordeum vulgare]|nr:Protein FAR1-RELATED SEQUENCE 5 [Hordeum vulgare]